MLLEVDSIKKEFNGHIVLDGISFTIGDKEVISLVGENGSGKTTLLKIIAGLEEADSGSVRKQPKDATVNYVPQAPEEENLKLTPVEMGISTEALIKLGISHLENSPLGNLSSGERTKVYLARLISQEADLLLLDEPTNHLDIEALEWLEDYLVDYQGSVLLVSHDRRFLDNLSQRTLELKDGKIKVYGGNYSFYRNQKAVEEEAQRRAYVVQQKKVKRITEEIREVKANVQGLETRTSGTDHYVRRKAAKAAKGALAMAKRLEKELTESDIQKPEPDFELSAIFKPKTESSQTVVYIRDATKTYDNGRGVAEPFNLLINKGEKVALLGPNGCGKTTVIKLLMGDEKPNGGKVEVGNNVEIGYLPQEQKSLGSDSTIIDNIITSTKLDRTSAYKLTRRFLFDDEDLRTSVKSLSSGQKSRLPIAKIMASGANFIILDEPTNHLDIPAREALEKAVVSYTGTLLVISHDRYFLETIKPDKVVYL